MIRKSFLIEVRPGYTEEYIRRHNPIWKSLEEIYRSHGVGNFSIFLASSGQLFGYLEVENEEKYAELEHNETCRRWWKYMAEILVCAPGETTKGKEELLQEVFHLS